MDRAPDAIEQRLARWIDAAASIRDETERREARTLAAALALGTVLVVSTAAVQALLVPDFPAVPVLIGTVGLALGYLLSRTSTYRAGAVVSGCAILAGGYLHGMQDPSSAVWHGFMLLSVVLAALALPVWGVVAMGFADVLAVAGSLIASGTLPSADAAAILSLHAVFVPLIVASAAHWRQTWVSGRSALGEATRSARVLSALEHAGAEMADATTEEEVFSTAARSLVALGCRATFLMAGEDGRLRIAYLPQSTLVRVAERVAGMTLDQFSFAPDATEFHRGVIGERQTVHTADSASLVQALVPGVGSAGAARIVRLLGMGNTIGTPLVVDDEAVGLLSVSAPFLSAEDTSMVGLFGKQVAATLKRARLHARLVEANDRWRALTHNLAGAVFEATTDAQWGLEFGFVSEGVEQLLGMSAAEVLARPTEALSRIDRDDLRALRQRLDSDPPAGDVTAELRLPGPPERCAEVVVRCDARPDGSLHWTGLLIDITARKRAQQDLQASQKQLMHSQKLEAVGQLAGGIAHDFNNFLTVVLGNLGSLDDALRAEHTPAVLEPLQEIQRAATRAADLTQQLLVFSRGRVSPEGAVDLASEVADLEKMLRRLLRDDVLLEVDCGAGPTLVDADPVHIEQIVMNLVLNATAAVGPGGCVRVETRKRETRVELVVRDDGAGMTQEVADRAFEPFFTTKGAGQGSGLGLAMVHGVVSDLGGTIALKTAPGDGTEVRVCLPHATTPAPAPRAAPHVAPRAAGGVLVLCEDDDAIRRLAGRVLRARGFEVHAYPNGALALEGVESLERVDGLVTDVLMPGMDGPTLAGHMRERFAGLPCLLMSGWAPEEALDAVDPSAVSLLRKPFSRDELLARVDDLLAGQE